MAKKRQNKVAPHNRYDPVLPSDVPSGVPDAERQKMVGRTDPAAYRKPVMPTMPIKYVRHTRAGTKVPVARTTATTVPTLSQEKLAVPGWKSNSSKFPVRPERSQRTPQRKTVPIVPHRSVKTTVTAPNQVTSPARKSVVTPPPPVEYARRKVTAMLDRVTLHSPSRKSAAAEPPRLPYPKSASGVSGIRVDRNRRVDRHIPLPPVEDAFDIGMLFGHPDSTGFDYMGVSGIQTCGPSFVYGGG